MLSEISQSQNDKYCMIPLIWGTKSSQIHGDRKQNGSCPELGEGGTEELAFNGFSFTDEESPVDGSTTKWMYLMLLYYTLKSGWW